MFTHVQRRLVSVSVCCGSLLAVFGVDVGDISPYVHVCTDCFSSVQVTEWPSFEKELPPRLTICSLGTMFICNFIYFPFWFNLR